MKAENDLPQPPAEPVEDQSNELFTEVSDGGDQAMLPGSDYDGAAPSTAPDAAPESIETKTGEKLLRLKLPNGHVYTGKTERELLEQVYKGKVAADEAIKDREDQIRTLRGQPRGPAPYVPNIPAPSAPAAGPASGDAWDPQRYLTLLGEDPMAARQYQDRFLYGGMDPVQATSYAYNVATKLDQQLLAAQFHDRNPDFPISPENSAKLMQVLQSRGLSPSLVNLEWGFGELKRNGLLSPAGPGAVDENEYEDIQFGAPAAPSRPPAVPAAAPANRPAPPTSNGQQRRGGGAPPSPRNGGGAQTPDVVSFDDMTLEQIKAHARKIGAMKH